MTTIINNKEEQMANDLRLHDKDTGSIEVQVSNLTARINHLNEHLKVNPKDQSTKRGLIRLVGQRRSFLSYIMGKDAQKHEMIIKRLGLRK